MLKIDAKTCARMLEIKKIDAKTNILAQFLAQILPHTILHKIVIFGDAFRKAFVRIWLSINNFKGWSRTQTTEKRFMTPAQKPLKIREVCRFSNRRRAKAVVLSYSITHWDLFFNFPKKTIRQKFNTTVLFFAKHNLTMLVIQIMHTVVRYLQ